MERRRPSIDYPAAGVVTEFLTVPDLKEIISGASTAVKSPFVSEMQRIGPNVYAECPVDIGGRDSAGIISPCARDDRRALADASAEV
jgi:hypothetical protein